MIRAAALAVALFAALPAAAQTSPPVTKSDAGSVARSRSLFDRGRRLAEQNLWEEACLLFEQAHELHATGGTALQLANCYEHVGKNEQAIVYYQFILDHADADAVEDRVRIARERLQALRPKPVVTAPPPPPPTKPSLRTPAYASLGAGGLGLLVGTVFGIAALAQASAVKDHCVDQVCPTAERDKADGARGSGWVSTIGFGVGFVGGAAGVVLLVIDGQRHASAGSDVRRLHAGPQGVSFSF